MATHHIAEDDLELYMLDRLAEPSAAPVEEHQLVSEEWRARLAGGFLPAAIAVRYSPPGMRLAGTRDGGLA
jgi:hypothetical protein